MTLPAKLSRQAFAGLGRQTFAALANPNYRRYFRRPGRSR